MAEIQFYANDKDGNSLEAVVVESDFVPRVGELVIFREVEDGEDIFGNYRVTEVVHRYLITGEGQAEPEFHVVSLEPHTAEE